MKRIITHLSPHLDEILAIWILKTFDPDFSGAVTSFKATNPQGGEVDLAAVDKDPDIIYLGLGRGKYDEHALEKEAASKVAAASLVWEDVKARGLAPKQSDKLSGVEKLLDYVLKDDHGELKSISHYLSDYTISALWSGFSQFNRGDSDKKLAYGLPLMDYMWTYLTNVAGAEEEIRGAKTFQSKWGSGIAIESESGSISPVAYRMGHVVLVGINPKLGYRRIVGATGSEVDLTEAYEKVKKIDPDSDWYLHQSKRMLISGSHSAPHVKVSRLSLDQLVDLIKV